MIWFVVIFIVILIIVSVTKQSKTEEKKGILFSCTDATYYGGFSDIEGGKQTDLIIYKDKIELNIIKKPSNVFDRYEKKIFIDNINYIGIKSKTQIQSEISLGKMFLFGVYSLAMKNDRVSVQNYLVLDYIDNNQSINIILNTKENEKVVQLVNNLKSKKS